MSDFMQEYEYYKTAWEKSLADRTKAINDRIVVLEAEIEILNRKIEKAKEAIINAIHDPYHDPYSHLDRALKEME